jgi:hypothetical protein
MAKTTRKFVHTGVVALIFLLAAAANAGDALPACSAPARLLYAPEAQKYGRSIAPGIPLALIAESAGRRWNSEELAGRSNLPAQRIKAAMVRVEAGGPQANIEEWLPPGGYEPTSPGTPTQADQYREAAKLYHERRYTESVPRFDDVARDRTSPYRSAAAYSAARASLLARSYADGVDRIQRILDDPSMSEFNDAARHLIGTLANQYGDAALIAARYVQASHMMLAPKEIICTGDEDAPLLRRLDEEHSDLGAYLALYQSGASSLDPPRVLDQIYAVDPLLELLRAFASPTPFEQSFPWPAVRLRPNEGFEWDGNRAIAREDGHSFVQRWASAEGRELTETARRRWKERKDLLWGYVLARRTNDSADLPSVVEMLDASWTLKGSSALNMARPALYLHFLQHAVRLAVVGGAPELGLDLIRTHTEYRAPVKAWLRSSADPLTDALDDSRAAIVEGPIAHYLNIGDFQRARAWAVATQDYAGDVVSPSMRPALATQPTLMLRSIPKDGTITQVGTWGYVLDLLPIKSQLALARDSAVAPAVRRASSGVALTRLFALQRLDEARAVLPLIGDLYPELASDVSRISKASSPAEANFLLARLFLMTPGLGIYASNLHDLGHYSRSIPLRDLRAIDYDNPNDSNWWCSFAQNRARRTIAGALILYPTRASIGGVPWYALRDGTPEGAAMAALGDDLIRQHPLFSETDRVEIDALANVEPAPKALARFVFDWADRSVKEKQTSERSEELASALAAIVRATRYGCRRGGSLRATSREAYTRLHRTFPNTPWARQTPYWFDIDNAWNSWAPAVN